MTTEQKAKAYDEALSVALETYQTQPMYRDWLEKMFPKLAEFKDERVRKALIDYFSEQDGILTSIGCSVGTKDILSWLETQGNLTIRFFTDEFEWALGRIIAFWNQNHKDGKYDENELMSYIKVRETELVKLFTDNVCKVSLSDCSEEYRKAYYDGYNKCNRDWLKIKDKIIDISVDEYNKNAEILLGWQVKQKPTDEEMKELLRTEYEKGRADSIAEMQKSWSEEDKRKLNDVIVALSEYANGNIPCILPSILLEDVDWLKDLKNRYIWNPTDEQIEILDMVLTNETMDENIERILRELREQLKKLKE